LEVGRDVTLAGLCLTPSANSLRGTRMQREQRISLVVFEDEPYKEAEEYFMEARTEVMVVFYGTVKSSPFKLGWVQLWISKVLIPDDNDYKIRTPAFIHMKRKFNDKIASFAEKTGLRPLIFDHKQPINEPSGRDVLTMCETAEYYPNSVLGSFGQFHRFFRLVEENPGGEQ